MQNKSIKLKLEELKVESFITALEKTEKQTINGGDLTWDAAVSVVSNGVASFVASYGGTYSAIVATGSLVESATLTTGTVTTTAATSVASVASAASLVVSAASVGYTVGMSLNYSQEAISEYFTVDTSVGSAVSNGISYLGGCSYWPLC